MSGKPTSYAALADVLASLPLLVRETRRAKQQTMAQAGAETGLSPSTFCRVEKGEDPSVAGLRALLRWMDAR